MKSLFILICVLLSLSAIANAKSITMPNGQQMKCSELENISSTSILCNAQDAETPAKYTVDGVTITIAWINYTNKNQIQTWRLELADSTKYEFHIRGSNKKIIFRDEIKLNEKNEVISGSTGYYSDYWQTFKVNGRRFPLVGKPIINGDGTIRMDYYSTTFASLGINLPILISVKDAKKFEESPSNVVTDLCMRLGLQNWAAAPTNFKALQINMLIEAFDFVSLTKKWFGPSLKQFYVVDTESKCAASNLTFSVDDLEFVKK